MGWLDRVKQTMEKAAGEAEEVAEVGKLKLEIRALNKRMEESLEAIGAKAYDLYESGRELPSEVRAFCLEAKRIADEIQTKEREIDQIKGRE